MKNLTDIHLTINRTDGSRVILPPAEKQPVLRKEDACLLGFLGAIEIYREAVISVDFSGIELNAVDQPFVVSREIFDALPANMHEFVTPDLGTAIYNSFGIMHVVQRLIAKGSAAIDDDPAPVAPERFRHPSRLKNQQL